MSVPSAESSLHVPRAVRDQIAAHVLEGYPYEACGLIVGRGAEVVRFVASDNLAASARVYTIDPKVHLRAERDAEDEGLEVIGVVHSHTHSEAYPSPTDVRQAPDPTWHYMIVTLAREVPEFRSFRIVGEVVSEETIEFVG